MTGLPYPVALWVKDPRERALSHEGGKWEPIEKLSDPLDIELDDKVRGAIGYENSSLTHWNENEVARRVMQAHGMGLVDYLESVLGSVGIPVGRIEDPASPVSAGSSHDVGHVPAASPGDVSSPNGI